MIFFLGKNWSEVLLTEIPMKLHFTQNVRTPHCSTCHTVWRLRPSAVEKERKLSALQKEKRLGIL